MKPLSANKDCTLVTLKNTLERLKIPALILLVFFVACSPKNEKAEKKALVIREQADATSLNPVSISDELSFCLSMQLFQTLLGLDYKTNQMVGVIANDRPELVLLENGAVKISYNIRKAAAFDNGRNITANDVLFSLKLNVAPHINNSGGSNYYNFIDSVGIPADDSLQIDFYCKQAAALFEFKSGDFAILPKENYDPQNVLSNYSFQQLISMEPDAEDSLLINFATAFNADRFSFDPTFIKGSGAYRLRSWDKGQRIIIEKKKDWWGFELKEENSFFVANAPEIQYEIINDATTAFQAFKSGKIDLMRNISPQDYLKLKEVNQSDSLYKLASVEKFGYQYLGFNLNKPLLKNKEVRKALAHLTPKKVIVDQVFQNFAIESYGPISSIQKELLNTEIKSYEFSLAKAESLLKENGWADNNEDGVLEKVIDGKEQKLALSYSFNAGNTERESIGLILQNEFKKAGVQLEVVGLEWAVYLEGLRNGNFDLFYGGVSTLPTPPDFTSSFHSTSANGGRNYTNYQSEIADSLIEAIKTNLDDVQRIELVQRFQKVLHEDLPCLFLVNPTEQIACSAQLKNVTFYPLRPHFWAPEISW